MDQRHAIITLAETLAAHQGMTHFAISMRVFGKGDFFKNMIDKGADCSTQTAARLVQWFAVAARAWIGTPFHHRASVRAVGCDCIGLVRGAWRDLLGAEPAALPNYARDWGDIEGVERLINGLLTVMLPVTLAAAGAGDVLVFRMRKGRVARHCAILTSASRFVHAWEATPVIETALTPWWSGRIAGVFRLPQPAGG